MKRAIFILTTISMSFFSCLNPNENDNTASQTLEKPVVVPDKFIGTWISALTIGEKNEHYKYVISRNTDERVVVKHGEGTYYSVQFYAPEELGGFLSQTLYYLEDNYITSGDPQDKLFIVKSSGHLMDNNYQEYSRVP